jgi:hypothetical protein
MGTTSSELPSRFLRSAVVAGTALAGLLVRGMGCDRSMGWFNREVRRSRKIRNRPETGVARTSSPLVYNQKLTRKAQRNIKDTHCHSTKISMKFGAKS